ncbi:hypothetical protein B0E53_02360 [Micromonospora sp. MH33]|uniref:hypothetical protein n=1 Tax=Micromonospora sp. MH33 TaxID=1945509 RepID=UPI000D2CFAFB|nr:hypothetical protein [Micromonospora sp. MH33]PSK65703.1 hypothetical protein B0E53_02360 [Micromonospora sp. MH33]
MKILRLGHVAIVGGALAMVVACGSDGSSSSPTSAGTPGTDDSVSAVTQAKGDECERLTKSEVSEVIGPNDGGQHDYQLGGCVWTAASAKDGLAEAIHATVLPKAQYEAVAEIGEPVSGFGDGATYDSGYGELWFPCRSGDFCGIKANINDPDKRKEIALRLGKILQGHV